MSAIWSGMLRGVAAGAAGTTALNATTYADMAWRARPASDAPQQLVSAVADRAGVSVPGDRTRRARRLDALGPLAGIVTGVGVGALAGALRAIGLRPPAIVGGPLLGLAAMAASDGPLAVLQVSDPRRWSTADWVADAVPHLVYGLTTHTTLASSGRVAEGRETVAVPSASVLLRSAALGAASGARTSGGLAAIAVTSAAADRGAVASRLGSRTGTVLIGAAAIAESIMDKLPSTPNRLSGGALAGRLVAGTTAAAAVARRDGHDPDLPGLIAAASAVGSAVAGERLRAVAAARFGSDRPGAIAEDVLTVLLGWLGARRPRAGRSTAAPLHR